ncbi:MAG TPA: class I SAM-dependent methyltransferase [Capillimicrobium sp.]|jgi:SAM-dependent methyltransferase
MADWQERITRDTKPSIRVEHDLRYAAAAPIVRSAPTWADLGCGAGVAAADALGDSELHRVVLVDADAGALDQAGRDLRARETVRVQADLATEEGVAAVRAALGDQPGAITCFEVVEHLTTFVPLVEALVELAAAGWTVVVSVPNDAFWALENPYHHTMWGEGSFEELRRLLPADAVVARQVPLDGSHLVVEGAEPPVPITLPPVAPRSDAVPSHFVAAFGPRAAELTPRALAIPSDLDGQRTWERQRESTLAVLEAELAELRAYVQWSSEEFARLNAPQELREQTPETVAQRNAAD